jgi:hypothetical protein
MYHPVDLELKKLLIDPFLTGTADGRGRSYLNDTPGLDYSGLKCETKKIK